MESFVHQDADYEGAKSSTKNLQGMMETIKGDMEKEIENGKQQDKQNQAAIALVKYVPFEIQLSL